MMLYSFRTLKVAQRSEARIYYLCRLYYMSYIGQAREKANRQGGNATGRVIGKAKQENRKEMTANCQVIRQEPRIGKIRAI